MPPPSKFFRLHTLIVEKTSEGEYIKYSINGTVKPLDMRLYQKDFEEDSHAISEEDARAIISLYAKK